MKFSFCLEILLGSTRYTKGVDIWAVGTILGEMINGKPIFPGSSVMNQIERILEVTHFPSSADIASIHSPYSATMLESIPQGAIRYRLIGEVFPTASSEAIDVIRFDTPLFFLLLQDRIHLFFCICFFMLFRSCFFFNPLSRPSSEDLLRHAYVSEFHNEVDEPVFPGGPIRLAIDDNVKLSEAEYRERLYQEITNRRRDARKKEQDKINGTSQPPLPSSSSGSQVGMSNSGSNGNLLPTTNSPTSASNGAGVNNNNNNNNSLGASGSTDKLPSVHSHRRMSGSGRQS